MKALKDIARIATVMMALATAASSCGKDSYIGEAEDDGSRYYIKYEAVSASEDGSLSEISTNTAVGAADFKATSEFQTVTGPVSRNFDTAITATVLASKSGEAGDVTTRIYVSKDAGEFVLVASASGEGTSHCEYRIDF